MTTPAPVMLRARTDADLDALFAIASELDTWEERGPLAPAPLARAVYEARLAAIEADTASGVQFVVDVAGSVAGVVSLFNHDSLAQHAEVGIALLPEFRGQGVGTAALTQIVDFAFRRWNLRRVHLEAIASNEAGLRSYEKVGFVVEGRRREHAWVRGAYEDIVMMGLLRAEWSAGADASAPVVAR